MKFPTTFPMDDLATLIGYFRDRTAHTNRDYAEAAWGVSGYALGQLVAAPQPVTAASLPATDEEKVECLEDCKAAMESAEDDRQQKAAVKGLDWSRIFAIALAILQQLGPLFGT